MGFGGDHARKTPPPSLKAIEDPWVRHVVQLKIDGGPSILETDRGMRLAIG